MSPHTERLGFPDGRAPRVVLPAETPMVR